MLLFTGRKDVRTVHGMLLIAFIKVYFGVLVVFNVMLYIAIQKLFVDS